MTTTIQVNRTNSSALQEVDPVTLRRWLEEDSAILIDVREAGEHAAERIPGAKLLPLSGFDPAQIPAIKEKKLVFLCRTGNRSLQACRGYSKVQEGQPYYLKGGLTAWKAAGFQTEKDEDAPIDIMRQVQIAAGSLVLTGILLSYFSIWFLALSVFVGAGQVFSGLTGTCAMASLLSKLPYNQPSKQATCPSPDRKF